MTWLAVVVKLGVDQIFCGHCPVRWAGKDLPVVAVRHVQEAHGVLAPRLGRDLWRGALYGPGPGRRVWKMRGGGHWSRRRVSQGAR